MEIILQNRYELRYMLNALPLSKFNYNFKFFRNKYQQNVRKTFIRGLKETTFVELQFQTSGVYL